MYISSSSGPLVLVYFDNTGNRKTWKTKGRCFIPFLFFFFFLLFSFALKGIQWWSSGAFEHGCEEDRREYTLKPARHTTEVQVPKERHIHCTLPAWQGGLEELWGGRLFCLSFLVYLGVFCCCVSIQLIWKFHMKIIFHVMKKTAIANSVYEL